MLQALEEFGDGFQFERLCNDIMHLHYTGFKPGGKVHDLGIDGLLELSDLETIRLYFKQSSDKSQVYIFQYSIQDTLESKIKATLAKLDENQIEYNRLIYVTSRNPTTSQITKMQIAAKKNYGRDLEIHAQEFLRMYLEEPANAHLIDNYFASYLNQLKRLGIETSIFANVPLAENYKRRALVLLSTCVRSQEGKEVKQHAASEVIIGCIYGNNGLDWKSTTDIKDELQTIFGDRSTFSDAFIESILEEIIKNYRIDKNENTFRLSPTEISRIEAKIGNSYEEDSSFYKSLMNDFENLNENQKKQIRFAIAKGIGSIFERKGIEIASALCGTCPSLSLNDYPEINIIARDIASTLESAELKNIVVKVLNRLFTSPTSFESEYLFGIAESYLVYASFNLDPDARILDSQSARENVLFIDTDILLQVFIGNEHLQELYKKILNITKNLGITMYTLPQLVHEFAYKINRSHEDYVYMKRPSRLSEEILNDLGDVCSYYFRKVASTGKTWDQFIGSLVGASRKEKDQEQFIEKRLETEYGILCKDFTSEISIDKNEVDAFANEIIKSRTKFQTFKHDNLCEHDAIAALTIEALQEKKGGQYWFLSNDNHLCKVWQSRRNQQKIRFFPTQNWYQYITNHPASKSKPVDFSVLMKSLSVSPSRPKIPRNLLLTLIRFGVNVSKYTTESLEELNKRLYSEWIWQQTITKKSSDISDDEIDELGKSLDRVLKGIEEDIAPGRVELKNKIRNSEIVIKELLSDKKQMQEELERYRVKEAKRKKYNERMKKQAIEKDKKKR